jgi:RNA recognition motif-containing protein
MVRTKVFVGNLSFKTQEADLAKEFEVAGKVATANIISRGSRSLGYGFVELESEEEARKAVELLHKKQIDGREIKVEVAKPREENATKEGAAPRAPRQRAPRPAGANNNNNANGGAAEGEAQGEGAAPRRRRVTPRRPRTRRPQNADGTPAAAGEGQKEGEQRAPRQPRTRPPRQPRPEGERAPKTAAPNTLFVANLPFSVDDEGLSKIFAGLNLKTAHVVRKRNNRSKGFGFVEFNSEEDQKKALAAVDKKTVENRELIVKVALTEVAAPAAAGEVPKKDATPASPKPATAN